MRKKGALIIECIDKDDPGSEGHALTHLFDLMQVDCRLVQTKSINRLLSHISNSEFRLVHISTHGAINAQEIFSGWWTPQGIGTRKQLDKYELDFSNLSIVSTACKSGYSDFGNYLVKDLACERYIGPKGSPTFYNSFLFAHILYHKLFIRKCRFGEAFRSYADRYKNPHRFSLFQKRSTFI